MNESVNEGDDIYVTAKQYWALIFLVIPGTTIFGNVLVVLSVVKFKSLQCAINYFILGLAIADCLVAVAVMPFAVYVHVRRCLCGFG